jgi:hypothetical protein
VQAVKTYITPACEEPVSGLELIFEGKRSQRLHRFSDRTLFWLIFLSMKDFQPFLYTGELWMPSSSNRLSKASFQKELEFT